MVLAYVGKGAGAGGGKRDPQGAILELFWQMRQMCYVSVGIHVSVRHSCVNMAFMHLTTVMTVGIHVSIGIPVSIGIHVSVRHSCVIVIHVS